MTGYEISSSEFRNRPLAWHLKWHEIKRILGTAPDDVPVLKILNDVISGQCIIGMGEDEKQNKKPHHSYHGIRHFERSEKMVISIS